MINSLSLKVILIEKSSGDIQQICKLFDALPEMKIFYYYFNSLDEAVIYLAEHTCDLLIINLDLLDSQGLKTFQHIRDKHSRLALIILSNIYDEALAARTFELKAHHYLIKKELDPINIKRTINYALEYKRAEETLQKQASLLINAQRIEQMGSWNLDIPSGHLIWSESTCSLFGITTAEFKETYEHFYSFIHPDDRSSLSAIHKCDAATKDFLEAEYRICRPDGEVRWMYERGHIECDSNGNAIRRQGIVMDITERKRNERIQRWEARILESISADLPLKKLLEQITIGIEEIIPKALASILLVDPDGIHIYRGAAPHLPEAFTAAIDGISAGPMVGSCGTAIYRRETVVVTDIETDVLWTDFRELAREHGLRACWSIPVINSAQKVVATFAVYYRKPHAPQPGDLQLIERIAHIVEIAIERNHKQQELRASKELFSNAFEHAVVGMGLFSLDGAWFRINPALSRMMGYTQAELMASTFQDITVPEDIEPNLQGLRELIANKRQIFTMEKRYYHKSGQIIWGYLSVSLVRDAAGQPLHFISQVQDITERKLTEEKILRLNRVYALLSQINNAIVHIHKQQELLEAVCHVAIETGKLRATWIGLLDEGSQDIRVVAKAGEIAGYLEESRARVGPLIESSGPFGTAIRENHATICNDLENDESFRPWREYALLKGYRSVAVFPLRLSGKIIGVFVLYADVRDFFDAQEVKLLEELASDISFAIQFIAQEERRRHAEMRMAEQAALLDKAQDAIIVWDLDHRILYWNKSAERVYGWIEEEAVGASLKKRLYKDDTPLFMAREITLTKGEWSGEIEQLTKTGQVIIVEGHWTLVRDDHGKPKSILSINTDITQRKKLEAQFLRAQRMESIGALAGGIAHDLNNVLSPIILSIDLLKRKIDDPAIHKILDTITTSAQHGAEMVNQVLSFARGLEGRRIYVQVKHLVHDMVKIAFDTFPKNIRMEEWVNPDLWLLQADPTQLHQVLLNLCVNARDAMSQGGQITISAENVLIDEQYAAMNLETPVGPYVKIEVKDTGSGIPDEIIDKIFDPFFTTKDVGKGTGLGLSTSLAIVKSHGGFIRVYSDLGKGTCFRIYLPAYTKAISAAVVEREEILTRGNGETILVVDDEAAIRQITKQTLEAFGYNVLLAINGVEAVSTYLQHRTQIALVLTDMMMPVMDGPATIEVLSRLNPHIRIISASGITANGKSSQTSLEGVSYFLPKPYTAETLLKAIKFVLTT